MVAGQAVIALRGVTRRFRIGAEQAIIALLGIVDLLLELRAERDMTILFATHDSQVAARCDRVVRLLDGRITDDVDVRAAVDVDATLRRLGRTAPG